MGPSLAPTMPDKSKPFGLPFNPLDILAEILSTGAMPAGSSAKPPVSAEPTSVPPAPQQEPYDDQLEAFRTRPGASMRKPVGDIMLPDEKKGLPVGLGPSGNTILGGEPDDPRWADLALRSKLRKPR